MKKKTIRILALLLCASLCVFAPIAYAAESEEEKPLYEETFNSDLSEMTDTDLWEILGDENTVTHTPNVIDGTLGIIGGGGVKFNWTKTENLGDYTEDTQYSFSFDVKINDTGLTESADSAADVLCVSFGDAYPQIKFNAKDKLTVGSVSEVEYSDEVFLGKTVHVTVSLEGNTVRSTVTDEDGYVIAHGETENDAYTLTEDTEMSSLVIRCGAGAVELNSFELSVRSYAKVGETALDIPADFAAVYSLTLKCPPESETAVMLDETELFAYGYGKLTVCGTEIAGSYPGGKYTVKAYVSPTEEIMYTEITLPNGGYLKRGTYALTDVSEIGVYSYLTKPFDRIAFDYEPIENEEEENEADSDNPPVIIDPSSPIHNIVTSFSDPTTTRYFAWTVKASALDRASTSLLYREKGAEEWIEAKIVKKTEEPEIITEDYFEADLTSLSPNTEYEYKITIKSNEDTLAFELGVYSFKTSEADSDEFNFIAIGGAEVDIDSLLPESNGALTDIIGEAVNNTENPSFILNTGDAVSDYSSVECWNAYFEAIGAYTASLPHFAAMGDAYGVYPNNYFSLHQSHPKNADSVQDDADGAVYSFDQSDIHFIVLKASYGEDDVQISDSQSAWLEADLEANKDAKWKIIIVNDALCAEDSVGEERNALYAVIESHGVDLVILGDSDTYSRSHPMKDGKIATKAARNSITKGKGTVYTTLSSVGRTDKRSDAHSGEEYFCAITPSSENPAYTSVSVTDDKVVVTTRQLDGFVLDEFSITDTTPKKVQLEAIEVIGLIVGPTVIVGVCGALLIAADNKKKKNNC